MEDHKDRDKYPKGKMDESDEGTLMVSCYVTDNRLVMDFGKELSWFGLDKTSLRAFITTLEEKYKLLT